MTKPFILVDGSSYLFRAFHAMPPLTSPSGQPTGAIYGVVNMLKKLINSYEPDLIAIIFDSPGPNFRHDLYPDYKANRLRMPDDLRLQIEPLFDVIRAMGLPLIRMAGVEADDVIATLARQARQQGLETLISSGDKDMAQLVDETTLMINPMTQERLDRQGVITKFGVAPEQILDYLVLIGDSVDNVPGVPKVGPKTAVKWLQQYGSLAGILEHQAEISGKVGENLRAFAPQIPLSLQLISLKETLELDFELESLKPKAEDIVKLQELYSQLDFKTWLKNLDERLPPSAPIQAPSAERSYETILSLELFERWLTRLENAERVSFDTETTGLDYMHANIVGLSFAIQANEAAYLPLAHCYEGAPAQLDREFVLARLKPWLEDPLKLKLGHNLKYDAEILLNHGIQLAGIHDDSLLMSYVINSINRHDFDSVALRTLQQKTTSFEDVAGRGAKQICFDQVDIATATHYACEDADLTLQIAQHFETQFEALPALYKVYRTIEQPLVPVLVQMERTGARIDSAKLSAQSLDLKARLDNLELEAFEMAGSPFNLNSPKQLQEILFERLGLPQLQKTPTGQASTSEAVLQELALNYPLPKLILSYRSLMKLKSTYTDRLPQQVNSDTGRVHTSYHQAITATGRLSSSDPNLQNIPIRSEEGLKIRSAFIAAPGCKLISADYSQIELRIMAHLSKDESLLSAFSEGRDVHSATAAEVFNVPLERVSANQRRDAKVINFGLIYGMSAFGLARTLSISRTDAERYMKMYFERFPGVKRYMDDTRKQAHAQGYVETVFGRRLYLPDLKLRVAGKQKNAERAAINAPMQGTAADIIKLAMIKLHHWASQDAPSVKMIMQVHDELIFELPSSDVKAVIPVIRQHMEGAARLECPLVVDIGVGDNWQEAH